jgi:excisionase family DNA binding protein
MRSVAEVAEMFGRAPRTIRTWIARGLVRPIKVGGAVFIPQSEVDALLTKDQPGKRAHRADRDKSKQVYSSIFQEHVQVFSGEKNGLWARRSLPVRGRGSKRHASAV